MGSVYIVRRKTVPGKEQRPVTTRFHVRYERDGHSPVVHLGVYGSLKEAKTRQASARKLVAQGKEPSRFEQPIVERGLMQTVARSWLASRIDVGERTRTNYTISVHQILTVFGRRDPVRITRDDVQEWVGTLSAGTVRLRLATLAQILDHAGVEPNPARARIRKPKRERGQPFLPTRKQLDAIYDHLSPQMAYGCRLLEHLGLRVGELVALDHRDIDRKGKRVLVVKGKTRSSTRHVTVLKSAVKLPDAGEGRVFDYSEQALRNALTRACELAGVPKITPHTLRHLHASRAWHSYKLSPAEVAARLGHASPAITMDVYSHLTPPD
jgi:integrase